MAKIDTIVIHHSASPQSTTLEEIRKWHVEGRGWRDVGYHLLLRMEPDGRAALLVGRPHDDDGHLDPWEYGAHTGGHNRHSFGVCTIGNWSEQDMPPGMLEGLVLLLADLCIRWELEPFEAIKGHREMSGAATECPGLRVDLDEIRAAVAHKLDNIRELNAQMGDQNG